MKEFVSLLMFAMKTVNKLFLIYHSSGCYVEKKLHKYLNLKGTYTDGDLRISVNVRVHIKIIT